MVLPVEIIAVKNKNGHRVLDYEAKQNDLEEVIAVNDKKVHKELCTIALNSFIALGGKTMEESISKQVSMASCIS